MSRRRILRADQIFDGTQFHHDKFLLIEDSRVLGIASSAELSSDELEAGVQEFPGCTITPGLIDSHVHLTLGTATRSYEQVMREDSDELMLLRSVYNGYLHLTRGVTTMRDCGARGRAIFELKGAVDGGLFNAFPRVLVSGRPITITGGHFHFCGEEADGVEGVRRSVRRLLKEGADFIKVMGSGGGTVRTDLGRASYSVEELQAIVDETHSHGKLCTIHCLAADSISNAVEAGFDCIEHAAFNHHDGHREFIPEVAQRLVDAGIWYSPTIQTGYRRLERLENQASTYDSNDVPAELQERIAAARDKVEGKLAVVGGFHKLGAKIIMGTDAIASFGDYALGLELLSRSGLSNIEVLQAATSKAAEALGIGDEVGQLVAGKEADVVVVQGNPEDDISVMEDVRFVLKSGTAVDLDPSLFELREVR